jgi:hypothetical protein
MSDFSPDVFNAVNPVVGVFIYSNGVMEIRRKSKLQGKMEYDKNGRKERDIVRFTPKSMARLVATINATDTDFRTMITLTYPGLFPKNGKHIKADLNRFLNIFRRQYPSEYLWFLEFQKRGAPHFHLLTEHDAITPRMRVAVSEAWVSGIARGDWYRISVAKEALKNTRVCEWDLFRKHLVNAYSFAMRKKTWEMLRSVDGAKRYVTKYAVKEYQKDPPEGFKGVGRFWGCSKNTKLRDGVYVDAEEQELRSFLEEQAHATANWEVLPKYLFSVKNI